MQRSRNWGLTSDFRRTLPEMRCLSPVSASSCAAAAQRPCAACSRSTASRRSLIQHRTRRKRRAADLQLHLRQFVRRIPQPSQLRAQVLLVDRAIPRRAQRRLALHRHAHRAHRPHRAAAVRLRAPPRAPSPPACEAASSPPYTPAPLYQHRDRACATPGRRAVCVRHGSHHCRSAVRRARSQRCARPLPAPRDSASRPHRTPRRRPV